jgi:hypothetical protein
MLTEPSARLERQGAERDPKLLIPRLDPKSDLDGKDGLSDDLLLELGVGRRQGRSEMMKSNGDIVRGGRGGDVIPAE